MLLSGKCQHGEGVAWWIMSTWRSKGNGVCGAMEKPRRRRRVG